MPMYSIFAGDVVNSLSGVTTTGAGTAYAIVPNPVRSENFVNWTYDFATAAPTSMTLDLESSMDNSVWINRDTYSTVATKTNRKASIGKDRFVRVKLTAVSIGSCTGITSVISV